MDTAAAAMARRQFSMDEEDELYQYAIEQSIIDAGSENDEVDIWEALKAQKPSQPNTPLMNRANRSPLPARASSSLGLPMSNEDQQLQRYRLHLYLSPTQVLLFTSIANMVNGLSQLPITDSIEIGPSFQWIGLQLDNEFSFIAE